MPPEGEIVYLVRSWPRLSQTFVLDEVLGLERLGLRLRIVALTEPDEARHQPEVGLASAPVHYLGRLGGRGRALRTHARAAAAAPVRYGRAAWHVHRHPEWDAGYHVARRWECLTLAAELSGLLRTWSRGSRGNPVQLHAHFAHDPAAVGFLTHLLTGVPWSFTGHARDVWQVPAAVLAERVRAARFVVACSRDVAEHLRSVVPARLHGRVQLVHHGVDLEAFRPGGRREVNGAVRIVSVGRLVEKKGFIDLLATLRLVSDRGVAFQCAIYGGGPMQGQLTELVDRLGLAGAVHLAGPRTRAELREILRTADLFALTPHITADGDRDGIPNALVEAMASGLPVVATSVGGIPEIIEDGENGLLAPAHDVEVIADRVTATIGDAGLRARLGAQARRTTVASFDARQGADTLARLFATAGGR